MDFRWNLEPLLTSGATIVICAICLIIMVMLKLIAQKTNFTLHQISKIMDMLKLRAENNLPCYNLTFTLLVMSCRHLQRVLIG
jgi:hypothetical protein